MSDLQLFLLHLRQPEYIHVLLNPLPVYGLVTGVLGLVLSLLSRSRQAQMLALAVVFAGAISAWPALYWGQRAYDRVYAMSNPDAQKWLDVHAERAETIVYVYSAAAAIAAAALLTHWRSKKVARPLTLLALLLSLASLAGGGWISQAGGQVRHSEFREGPPAHPVEESERGR